MHSKLFALILLELLLATTCKVHGGHDDKKFTNRWAVEVLGGSAAADTLAKKYGFINMGQVNDSVLCQPLMVVLNVTDKPTQHQIRADTGPDSDCITSTTLL